MELTRRELINKRVARAIYDSLNDKAKSILSELCWTDKGVTFEGFYDYLTDTLSSDIEYDLGINIEKGDL